MRGCLSHYCERSSGTRASFRNRGRKEDVLLQSALGAAILDTHRRMCSEYDGTSEVWSRRWLRMIEYMRDLHAGTGRLGELAHDFSRFPRMFPAQK